MLFSTIIVAALASLAAAKPAAKLKPRLSDYEYCLTQCKDQFTTCTDTTGEVNESVVVLGIDVACGQETEYCQTLCTADDLAFGAEEKVPKV